MFTQPHATQGDINFRLFGFPVRIHPFFWLIALLLGMQNNSVRGIILWAIAVLVSILVHELGHAFMMRHFGLTPHIVLYGLGGMTAYPTHQLTSSRASGWREQILISFAGPGAGFLLAATVFAIIASSGHSVYFNFTLESRFLFNFGFSPYESELLNYFFYSLLWISIAWGILNLMPIYPLDGGHIAREVCLRINRAKGIEWASLIAILVAGLLSFYALREKSFFMLLFFGYFAFINYQTYQQSRGARW
jgi:stage IV sporulation protein FB